MNPTGLTAATLLTADDVADRWKVPKSHVYRLTRGDQLPVVRLGKYVRYTLAAVEQFEATGGTEERKAA